jgi:hypothetical protein
MFIALHAVEIASAAAFAEATFYPKEPTTLTLAFIAVAVVVGYLRTARRRRPAECERVVPAARRDRDGSKRDAA